MNRSCLSIIIGVGLFLFAHTASGQLPAKKPKAPPDNVVGRDNSDAKAEADRIAKQRRTNARLLLISLASEAHSFRNQTLRARAMARIADALWSVDAEQGRALFRKAWEAAETGDKESQEPLDLRSEVLALAAKRDRPLAEAFLQKLKADQQEAKAEPSEHNLWSLQEASEQRLMLAQELLRAGDLERALQFADPVIGSVTISTLEFLTDLREKDPAAADQRYTAMLANTGANMLADANIISLLASYLFTPHMYVVFNAEGAPSMSMMSSSFSPASVDQRLRLAFFQLAAGVLLRPQPTPQQGQSATGTAIKYMVLKRLMPIFEQYAPKEITDAMRGQFEGFNSQVGDSLSQTESEWVQKGIIPEKELLAEQEHSLQEQIERAKTSDERDELYFKLALLALSKDNPKARDHVSKIEESSFRKRVQAWVDWGLAMSAIKKKKVELALEFARNGELTHIQRLWVLTESAKLLAKTDRVKALSLLDDATAEARRMEGADLDRARGLLAIANALELIEPSRAWDAILDAVKAANSTEGFTGEDGQLTQTINSKSRILRRMENVPEFDIEGIFGKLANSDYERAVLLARGFHSEAARANATITIARAVLNERSSPLTTPQPVPKN